MFADLRVARLDGMFSHVLQVGMLWTANALRVGKRFGEIRPGEAKEFGFVKITKPTSLATRHRFPLPGFNSSF